MARSLSEKKALQILNIPDFRHLSKDKIVEFTAMLPQMDRDVAMKALDQIPEYVKLASEIIRTYRSVIDKMFEANAKDTQAFYCACNQILNSLDRQLQSDNISEELRDHLNDQMLTVAKMISDKGAADKKFWREVLGDLGKVAFGIVSIAGVILGAKFTKTKK